MLSIGKLGRGQEHYYLAAVGRGVEDYYLDPGEAPGLWVGSVSEELGLHGVVQADDLVAVLRAEHPQTGQQLGAANRRVPGFDLCFRAPKSVSVLFGLGDPDVAESVRTAHARAVDQAISYLEREAGFSRRGHNGAAHVETSGFVAAAFQHRTSRAGDPHLHTHVLVANLCQGVDGRWATLDGHLLYEQARTAGFVYETVLRHELCRTLAVEWGPVRNGIADLVGIEEPLLRAFSTRRAEIEARMAARGETSAKAAEVAALDTRRAKRNIDPATLVGEWHVRAEGLGLDATRLRAVTGRARMLEPSQYRIVSALVAPEGLTAHASTFDRTDVIRGVCEQLVAGAELSEIEHIAGVVLDHQDVTPLTGPLPLGPDRLRHSTLDMLDVERTTLTAALERRDRGVGVVDAEGLVAALGVRPSISDEQARVVSSLVSSGHGVELLVAPAGTGKTFTLDAARDAWERSGYRVIGAALAARAAAELQAGTGIRSFTLHRLVSDLAVADDGGLGRASIVVVDEAAMAGTRQLAKLLDAARTAEAKVVLIGDPRQLPSIDAGGLLAGLAERHGALTLVENRRQHEPWERDALVQLRAGDVTEALAAYRQHDRITTSETAIAARDAMVADWLAATVAGTPTIMLAARRYDVEDLNARARSALARTKVLSGPELIVGDRVFQAGDRVLALRNDYRAQLLNGTQGTVVAVDPTARQVIIETHTGRHITVPTKYLDAGHLDHGYAMTVHKAQGMTIDRALLLGSDALYRELGYVGMSRGREANHLYEVATRDPGEHHVPQPEPLDIAHTLEVRREQHLAHDQLGGYDRTLAALIAERTELRCNLGAPPPDPDRQLAALQREHDRLAEQRIAVDARMAELQPRRSWRKPHPDIAILTARHAHIDTKIKDLDDHIATVIPQIPAGRAELARHLASRAQLEEIDRTIEIRLETIADRHVQAPPGYLVKILGDIPDRIKDRASHAWRDAAKTVEQHRAQHHVDTPADALGPRPRDTFDRVPWDITRRDVVDATRRLEHARARALGREPPDTGWDRGR